MSIQAQTVLNSLKVCSDVKIVFKSLLTSNKVHIGHYTLVDKPIQNQANDTDTIVAGQIEYKISQDISVTTDTQTNENNLENVGTLL